MSEQLRCNAQRSNGKQCTFYAYDVTGRCFRHHADPAVRKKHMGALGAAGRRSQVEAARQRRDDCPLRTTEEKLAALERRAIAVENSSESAAKKADAIVKLVRASMEVQHRVGDLERENKELRNLLLERHPELRGRLRLA